MPHPNLPLFVAEISQPPHQKPLFIHRGGIVAHTTHRQRKLEQKHGKDQQPVGAAGGHTTKAGHAPGILSPAQGASNVRPVARMTRSEGSPGWSRLWPSPRT